MSFLEKATSGLNRGNVRFLCSGAAQKAFAANNPASCSPHHSDAGSLVMDMDRAGSGGEEWRDGSESPPRVMPADHLALADTMMAAGAREGATITVPSPALQTREEEGGQALPAPAGHQTTAPAAVLQESTNITCN